MPCEKHARTNVAQAQGPAEIISKYGGNEPPLVMVPVDEAQTESISEPESWESAEKLVREVRPKLRWGGDQAYYSLAHDAISMPDRHRFETQAGLYSVLMYEVGHWSGHSKRLHRDLAGAEGTPEYLV
jgi:antirestriction protein ArdC